MNQHVQYIGRNHTDLIDKDVGPAASGDRIRSGVCILYPQVWRRRNMKSAVDCCGSRRAVIACLTCGHPSTGLKVHGGHSGRSKT